MRCLLKAAVNVGDDGASAGEMREDGGFVCAHRYQHQPPAPSAPHVPALPHLSAYVHARAVVVR